MLAPFALIAAAAASGAHADAVTDWNSNAIQAAHAACLGDNPLYESRLYAMVHIAVHDALNAIQPRSRPYAYTGVPAASALPEAAVASAAREILVSQFKAMQIPPECLAAGLKRTETDYSNAFKSWSERGGVGEAVRIGREAAAAVIARRAHDGSDAPLVDPKFAQGTQPGQWRFTPGSPPVAFGTSWGKVKPFALRSADQFQPEAPLAVSCAMQQNKESCTRYANDLEEVRRLGGDGKSAPTSRTSDQTQIALFWEESSPTSWNRLARDVSAQKGLDMWDGARLLALMNTAMADGYIASWATKYHYLFWRPVTAVRLAEEDGNPATHGDPQWNSLRPTPPLPDYESAHAVQGAAAAAVLRAVFATDAIEFSTCSFSLPEGSRCTDASPVRRHFTSFSQAARENALSRIYIGFHFRNAVDKGLRHGDLIGRWTVDHAFARDGTVVGAKR